MRRPLSLALLLALAPPPLAAQRSLAIRNFDATIAVNPDATIDVTESITVSFTGSWNGIYRTIPVEYRTPQGFNWTLHLQFLGATAGPEARPLKVESSRERHYLKYKIWVPGAENATHTISLHYRARNGLRFFPDHDELYWNVTGDEWDVPIEAASAVIHLPAKATGLRAIAFNGAYGSTARDARVDTAGTVVRLSMPHGLGFHEGLTAVVGWDKGVVTPPTSTEKAAGFLASNWPLIIPMLVFAGMFTLWNRVGRDPRRLPVAVQYEPPGGLTPAEAGTLMDESADMRDITATLVDLAVRGHLKIEERDEEVLFGLFKKKDYVFHRLEPAGGSTALQPHESKVLSGIFQGKTEVRLSELENEFYQYLPDIRGSIFGGLVRRGLYRSRPDTLKSRWQAGGVVLGMLIFGGGAALGARLSLTPVPFAIAAVLSGLIVVLFAQVMPARTVAGARALEKVLGFEEFLGRVEGERYQRIVKTPEMFEKFLPFAMAFRVEKRWAQAFRDIYREPPRWYTGGAAWVGPFDLDRFSNRLSDLSSRTQSTMTSSPRSSSGSGFSGGSSGGGGGGGGGGGF
jgi:uncharacterized membrane protein YgcG